MPAPDCPVVIEALIPDDGGGYVASVPDLPGCTSTGETREFAETQSVCGWAARDVGDAIDQWVEEVSALGRPIPAPSRHLASAQG